MESADDDGGGSGDDGGGGVGGDGDDDDDELTRLRRRISRTLSKWLFGLFCLSLALLLCRRSQSSAASESSRRPQRKAAENLVSGSLRMRTDSKRQL